MHKIGRDYLIINRLVLNIDELTADIKNTSLIFARVFIPMSNEPQGHVHHNCLYLIRSYFRQTLSFSLPIATHCGEGIVLR